MYVICVYIYIDFYNNTFTPLKCCPKESVPNISDHIAAPGAAQRSVGHVSLLWNRHCGSVDAGEKRV